MDGFMKRDPFARVNRRWIRTLKSAADVIRVGTTNAVRERSDQLLLWIEKIVRDRRQPDVKLSCERASLVFKVLQSSPIGSFKLIWTVIHHKVSSARDDPIHGAERRSAESRGSANYPHLAMQFA